VLFPVLLSQCLPFISLLSPTFNATSLRGLEAFCVLLVEFGRKPVQMKSILMLLVAEKILESMIKRPDYID